MYSLPASIKRIGSKTTKKKWTHHFPNCKSMGGVFRRSRADKFELLLDIMHVLDTYTFKIDRINSNREKVATLIFRRSRAANSVDRGQIWPNFKLFQALMYVIVTCKYKKDSIKNSREKWQRRFPHYKPMGIFF